jgi:hypothetical protein
VKNYKKEISKVIDIFMNREQLFIRKNENYGCSYIKTGEILAQIFQGSPITLQSPEDHAAYGIIVRKLDKIVRYCNLRFTGEKDKVKEDISETIGDDGVYSFMLEGLEKK